VFGVLVLAGAQSEADREREEISEFTSLVEAQLYQSGAAQQSFAGPVVLPQLGQTISEIGAGRVKEDDVLQNAVGWSDVATRAGEGVGGIEADLAGLKEARHLLEQGLLLYAELADEVRVAVQLEGDPQKDLVDSIEEQIQVAAVIFDTGYGLLQEERRKAGLPTQSALPGGIPGGVPGIPGGVPGG
jgi:hypothetical protein